MNLNLLKDIKNAYANLKPGKVRELAEKRVSIGVLAADEDKAEFIRQFLRGANPEESAVSPGASVELVGDPARVDQYDLLFAEPEYPRPSHAFEFQFRDPELTLSEVLDQRQELEVSLARHYPAFRRPVVDRIVQRTSKENALFTLFTALPNVIPSFLELPWAIGEFASDTAFLTMNQVRMAFLVAASNDHEIGYDDQRYELGGIVAGAFGWRAIARELAGKIPLGGGLIPKAAISYAGTYVVGRGLERLHGTGRGFDKEEQRALYLAAVEKGKEVMERVMEKVKSRNAA